MSKSPYAQEDRPDRDPPDPHAPDPDAPEADAPEPAAPEADAPDPDAPEAGAAKAGAPKAGAPKADADGPGGGGSGGGGGGQPPKEPGKGTPYGMLLVMTALLAVVIVFGIGMRAAKWNPESPAPMIAAMTATFAVIGTLVGSYFGVKAGLDGQYVQQSANAARDTDINEERKRWEQLRDDRDRIKQQDERIRQLEDELQKANE